MGREKKIRMGTRGSALALRQTQLMTDALRQAHPEIEVETIVIRTEGDRVADRPLADFGDKGVFVRSIERALLDGAIDLATHSLKDLPSDVETPGLTLAAFSPRADPRDVIVSRSGASLASLPGGGRIGTGSLRRRVQLLAARPDLCPDDIRGNVDTRLRKVRDGEYDAVIIAAAGVLRLGLDDAISEYLPVEQFTPDAGQGIMTIQGRDGDWATELARTIDDAAGHAAAVAERAVVRALGADCHSPVGAFARIDGNRLDLIAVAATNDRSRLERAESSGRTIDAESIGTAMGRRLLAALAAYTGP